MEQSKPKRRKRMSSIDAILKLLVKQYGGPVAYRILPASDRYEFTDGYGKVLAYARHTAKRASDYWLEYA